MPSAHRIAVQCRSVLAVAVTCFWFMTLLLPKPAHAVQAAPPASMEKVAIAKDGTRFILGDTGKTFVP